ncbi:hypothetical protein K450DRAFT_249358 [Umbelopsis ramanniana AG]|uniref:NAD-dependent epimerase/dehydratase domain-containing protein n=1 Tax=Umbelopsis ramanniana AG TaxID=1314678 RepID=A0AAD5HDA4_UMBRA|nr:uncharacterized protein K450DRAFT_249358 [Umbelopsis ramanniana AG]KAI8577983.1 hypothetical protein K450DRAFT_249358 [Umbelopsis ramanniana AG]
MSSTNSRVLVTGVNGYIGAQVANAFLEAGYSVIGTSRKAAKAQKLKDFFRKFGEDKFEVAEVADLEDEGAFDDLVKRVDVIAHVASPTFQQSDDPLRDIIGKAVNGTLSVLRSATAHGKNVKHIVVTSSVAAVINSPNPPEYSHTEKDWNETAFPTVQRSIENGHSVPHMVSYAASKAEAERALWKYYAEAKPHYKLTTILPSFVLGPILPPPGSGSELSDTTALLAIDFYTGKNQDPTFSFGSNNFVSVLDVAKAHVKAAEGGDKTDGQRYILSARGFSFQEVVDVFRKAYPDRKNIIAEGQPGVYSPSSKTIDGSKAARDLDIVYAGLESTLLETIDSVKNAV